MLVLFNRNLSTGRRRTGKKGLWLTRNSDALFMGGFFLKALNPIHFVILSKNYEKMFAMTNLILQKSLNNWQLN